MSFIDAFIAEPFSGDERHVRRIAQLAEYESTGDIAGKGEAASKAIQIIEEGLRASLDRDVGGSIALQLDSLYEYMCHRLLMASMGNDPIGFSEVATLLSDLRDAWAGIGEKQQAKPQPAMRLV